MFFTPFSGPVLALLSNLGCVLPVRVSFFRSKMSLNVYERRPTSNNVISANMVKADTIAVTRMDAHVADAVTSAGTVGAKVGGKVRVGLNDG